MESPSGEVVHKKKPSPSVKPPRRRPSTMNVSQRADYHAKYMKEERAQGKYYQKQPDAIKELHRKQKKRLKDKFQAAKVAGQWISTAY